MTKLLLIILFSIFTHSSAQASACCGGASSSANLISGDNKAQLSAATSHAEITDDVRADGTWSRRTAPEYIDSFKIEGAHLLSDRLQAGFSIPVIRRSREQHSSSGLSDITSHLGYEYLTDWDYHPWRPKGIGYLRAIFPTGKSIYETDDNFGLDSRGRGFWSLGIGTLLTKVFKKWDGFINLEFQRSFSKTVAASQFKGAAVPGWGGAAGFGLGYNWLDWRLGGNLNWMYEDGVELQSSENLNGNMKAQAQRLTEATLVLSYLIQSDWTASVSYSDQTLFGAPSNTALTQSAALSIQKRWER
ncbi:MAG: serine protease spb1 [Bdellovibrionales bacterium]